jgi:toxin YhaV
VTTRNGWTLLFHECVIEQLRKLEAAAAKARANDPHGSNANVKLFNALVHLIFEVIPADPGRDDYRQGNTMGGEFRHWRRAKIGRRFRLFFRYDTKAQVIIFAWVNDEKTLRSSGAKTDPYIVFQKMLRSGNPPDAWDQLKAAAKENWQG